MGRKSIRIREARERAGLSRPEMSKMIYNMPVRTIENWEWGSREVSEWLESLIVEKLERIASGKE